VKYFSLLILFGLVGCWEKRDAYKGAPEVANFVLIGDNDQSFELNRNGDVKAVAFVSAASGCPVLRKYYEEIEKISADYAGQIRFYYIDPQNEYPTDEFNKEKSDFKISIPTLFDPTQEVSRILGFTRSTEVAVVETGKMRLVYRGAIDDRVDYSGEANKAKQTFLRDNLQRIIKGEPVVHDHAAPKGCAISYDKVAPEYFSHVKGIIDKKCVMCHAPNGASPDLSTPEKVKNWSAMIRDVLLMKLMPPYSFDARYGPYEFISEGVVTASEQKAIFAWIRGEQKIGRPDSKAREVKIQRPWLRKFNFDMPLPGFAEKIPANGNQPFRYFQAYGPAQKDFYITAVLFAAEPRRAFGHFRLLVLSEPLEKLREAGDLHQQLYRGVSPYMTGKVGWIPKSAGANVPTREILPEGTGMLVRKGDYLVFDSHLRTTGKPETVSGSAKLQTQEVSRKLKTLHLQYVAQGEMVLPAGGRNLKFSKEVEIQQDMDLYRVVLHEHLRGIAGKISATTPDGKTRILLSVPHFNPDGLDKFTFVKPVFLPKGTKVLLEGVFDNSKYLARNPNPAVDVRWGPDYEKEEMLGTELYFTER
jgi:thiol-disulfide isomerase/thioredoxin